MGCGGSASGGAAAQRQGQPEGRRRRQIDYPEGEERFQRHHEGVDRRQEKLIDLGEQGDGRGDQDKKGQALGAVGYLVKANLTPADVVDKVKSYFQEKH